MTAARPMHDTRSHRPAPRAGLRATLLVLAIAGALSAGCSAPQAYASGQAMQRQQCERIADAQERARCLERAAVPYDDYRRERETTRAGR